MVRKFFLPATKGQNIQKVLIVVEDPGAANMVKDLPQALLQRNIESKLYALNSAYTYLLNRQHQCQPWSTNDDFARDLLEQDKPHLVVVGSSDNPQSPVLKLIALAKLAKIPTLGVVDMRMNADKRFSGGSGNALAFMPDSLVVSDEATRADFLKLGLGEKQIAALGNPQFDYIYKNALECQKTASKNDLKAELFPDCGERPLLLFIAEPESAVNPQLTSKNERYTLTGTSESTSRCRIVIEEFLQALEKKASANKPYLVLRLHPRNKLEDFPISLREKFDAISQHQVPIKLLCAADLVAGMTSMMLLEAAICNTATLSIVPVIEEGDWLPTVAAGATTIVSTRDELEDFFSQAISIKPRTDWFKPGALERLSDYIKNYRAEKQ